MLLSPTGSQRLILAFRRQQSSMKGSVSIQKRLMACTSGYPERAQFSIQVRALDSQRLRRRADSAAVLLEHGRYVLSFKPDTGLLQRPAIGEDRRPAVQPDVREHVLEPDAPAALRSPHHRLEERPQLGGVSPPRQRRDQRERRTRQ